MEYTHIHTEIADIRGRLLPHPRYQIKTSYLN